MTPFDEQPREDTMDAAAAELESVRGLMQLMRNASKVFQCYPPNNRLYLDLANQLEEQFTTHLEDYGDLVISVSQHECLFDEEVVYSERDPFRSLALRLYRDGVRRVRFLPGLEREEIVDFVKILARPMSTDSLDDDVVTLLWEQDFSHVKYAVLAEVAGDASGARVGEALIEEVGPRAGGEAEAAAGPPTPDFKAEYKDVRSELQQITEEVKAAVAGLSEEALVELQDRIQQEAAHDITDRAGRILFETCVSEKDPEVTALAVALLGQVVRAEIAEGRIDSATKSLARLKRLMSSDVGSGTQEKKLVEQEMAKLGELETLHQLAAASQEDPSRMPELVRLLRVWGKEGIVPAITLTGMVADQQAMIDALVEMSRGHAERLVQPLQTPEAAVIALRVLREVGDPSIMPEFEALLRHGDARMKLETVYTVQKVQGRGAVQVLELAAKDEDARVRHAGTYVLGQFPGTETVELLKGLIFEKGFINKSLEEKRMVFSALAEAGGESVLPVLVDILSKRRWLHADRQNETRACAAYALGLIGTAGAARVLQAFQDTGAAVVRSACLTALTRIGSGQRNVRDNG